MLDTAQKVNSKFVNWKMSCRMKKDKKIIVQIYEIQNPQEAEELIQIGVDHIGSVIVSETDWKVSGVRDTMDLVSSSSAKSCLIPLFNSSDSVWRTLDYYQPDIVHFCFKKDFKKVKQLIGAARATEKVLGG